MSVLLAHKDTSIVSEAVVRNEPRPDFTDSWRPYSHAEVIDAVDGACQTLGWNVVRKTYSIAKNSKMFSVWDLDRMGDKVVKEKEQTLSIGIRNSIDKSLSVGICAGIRVFVCDNLVFRGDFVLFRKHTSGLEAEELPLMAEESLNALSVRFARVQTWHENLKTIDITDRQASTLAVAAMSRQSDPVLPPSKFLRFFDLYFNGDRYTRTLHGFHGAITEMYQETHLVDYMIRTRRLNHFLDYEAPLVINATGHIPFVDLRMRADDKKNEERDEVKAEVRAEVKAVKAVIKERLREEAKDIVDPVTGMSPAMVKAEEEMRAERAKATMKAVKKAYDTIPFKKMAKEAAAFVRAKKSKAKTTERAVFSPKEHEATGLTAIAKDLTKKRRTARVRMREAIAEESAPVKTKKGKAPKGEVVRKRGFKKIAFLDDEDVLFCEGCDNEFKESEVKKVRVGKEDKLLCPKCRAK